MRPALIIIDMQEGSFTPCGIRNDSVGLVVRLNSLAQPWRYHAPLRVAHSLGQVATSIIPCRFMPFQRASVVLAALAVRAALVVI